MKQLKHDLWTDGEHEYTGNPKAGFKKITKSKETKETKEPKIVDFEAHELQQPKKEVDNEDKV